jgi:hypothetical protein
VLQREIPGSKTHTSAPMCINWLTAISEDASGIPKEHIISVAPISDTCVCMTPFGRAVVPDVYMIAAS